ncbi:MAG: glycerophosphoryl diester phosphodiesterase [Frankiales bacterium]|nr:glycerophosphoryl diester phosphodiesterase [Frankiales bacterium]
MADRPENSLEAFEHALSLGVTGLESDIWLGSQGEPVLSHGPPGAGSVQLAELFGRCGTDFDLSLDMRGPGAAVRTVEVARAAGFDLSRLWLCGGGLRSAPWRELDPDVRLVTDLRWRDAVLRSRSAMAAARSAGIDAVNLRHGRWSRRLIRHAHEAGLLAFGWDVQFAWTMRRAVRRGLDAVYSDRPRLLVEVLPL